MSLHGALAHNTTCLLYCSYQTCRAASSLQVKEVSAELQCDQQLLALIQLVLGDAIGLHRLSTHYLSP